MYQPPNKNIWQGREDTNEGEFGLRWHQRVETIDLREHQLPKLKMHDKGIVILGSKCDEGVRRNQGRTGAIEGPDQMRRACCNLADHFHEHTILFDGGNVACNDGNLEEAQSILREYVRKVRESGYFPLVMGGGHELAYPDFMGLVDGVENDEHIGIINIDAHFDLRIPDPRSSSGTPFYQISDELDSKNQKLKYMCLGIQPSTNTMALFHRAAELGVEYILNSEINDNQLDEVYQKINAFIQSVDDVYLTICLDVFDISVAPGVSAPSAIGMKPETALQLIKQIQKSGKLIMADIAELNPRVDTNDMTSKLASKLVYEILSNIKH